MSFVLAWGLGGVGVGMVGVTLLEFLRDCATHDIEIRPSPGVRWSLKINPILKFVLKSMRKSNRFTQNNDRKKENKAKTGTQSLKCLWNKIFGSHFIVSHERPFDTKTIAIYRLSISLLVPELWKFKDGEISVICGTKNMSVQQNLWLHMIRLPVFLKI